MGTSRETTNYPCVSKFIPNPMNHIPLPVMVMGGNKNWIYTAFSDVLHDSL